MSLWTRKNIRRDLNLASAGGFSSADLDIIKAALDGVYTVSFLIPGSSQTVSLEAPWARTSLSVRGGDRISGEAVVEIVENQERTLLNTQVNLLVFYSAELATETDTYSLVGSDLTSGQVARALVEQAGGQLLWDSALDYPVVSLLSPTESYSGTLREALDKLLRPFNQGPDRLAHILVQGQTVTCLLQDSTGDFYQVVDLDIADGHWIESLTINRESKVQALAGTSKIAILYHQPKTIQQQTLTAREDRIDGDGNVVERKTTTTTLWGSFITQEVEEVHRRGVVWIDELQTEAEWRLILVSRKTTTYEYDPPLADPNIYYIRSRRLVRKTIEEASYSNGQLTQTKTTSIAYEYDDEGFLVSEVETDSFLFPDLPEETIVKTIITSYERLSPDVYKITTEEASHRIIYVLQQPGQLPPPYSNPTNDWTKVEDFTMETLVSERTIAGQAPRVPSLPPVFSEDRVNTIEYDVEIQSTGATTVVETYFNPSALLSLYQRVYGSSSNKWTVRIEARSLYDLQPGTWINLACSKAIKIVSRTPADSKEYLLSDILKELPPLFVKSVEISQEGPDQIVSVEATAWS